MPTCKNGKGSYKGTEKSPTGRGFCARHEKIGTKKRGRDKQMWIVRGVKLASGKRSRRWFKVLPPVKKSKRKASTKTKVSTKRKRKLRGGETMLEKIKSLNMNDYSDAIQLMIKGYQRKLNDGGLTEQKVCKEISDFISLLTNLKKKGSNVDTRLTDSKDLQTILCHEDFVNIRTLYGTSQMISYAKNENVHDTLTNAGLDNTKKLILEGNKVIYNSKNKNLTWKQLENKVTGNLQDYGCLHAI